MSSHVIQHHASLPSTNAHARQLVEAGEGAPGLVIVADAQSAGRGQRGHLWHTVPGRSLAASVIIGRPRQGRPTRITILAALAAARALESQGADPMLIKWPNDLLLDGRKIGGLLVEVARSPAGAERLVVGLGLNLSLEPGDLPPELDTRAGDAGLPGGASTRDAVLAAFLTQLDASLAALGTAADEHNGEEYRRRSWISGRQVELLWAGRRETVRVRDVTPDGDLLLADGRTALGEHVSLL